MCVFQNFVLNGMYPYVVMKLDVLLSSGAQFELHLRIDAAMRRLDCHVFYGPSVNLFGIVCYQPHGQCAARSSDCSCDSSGGSIGHEAF